MAEAQVKRARTETEAETEVGKKAAAAAEVQVGEMVNVVYVRTHRSCLENPRMQEHRMTFRVPKEKLPAEMPNPWIIELIYHMSDGDADTNYKDDRNDRLPKELQELFRVPDTSDGLEITKETVEGFARKQLATFSLNTLLQPVEGFQEIAQKYNEHRERSTARSVELAKSALDESAKNAAEKEMRQQLKVINDEACKWVVTKVFGAMPEQELRKLMFKDEQDFHKFYDLPVNFLPRGTVPWTDDGTERFQTIVIQTVGLEC